MRQISDEQIVDVIEKMTEEYGFKKGLSVSCLPGGKGFISRYNPDSKILLGFEYSLEKKFIYMWEGNSGGKPTNAISIQLPFDNLEECLDVILKEYKDRSIKMD